MRSNSTSSRLLIALALLLAPATPAIGDATGGGLATLRNDPASSGGTSPARQASTTVILVRHAEKAGEGDPELGGAPPADPPLNAAGRERAATLARTLGEADVTAIYSSEFARTRQTVEPLADLLGLGVMAHPAADTAGLVERVRTDHRGGTVVIAGHSNTVPEIIAALGAPEVAPIEDAWEYDNLYLVVVEPSGEARVMTLKYGAPSGR